MLGSVGGLRTDTVEGGTLFGFVLADSVVPRLSVAGTVFLAEVSGSAKTARTCCGMRNLHEAKPAPEARRIPKNTSSPFLVATRAANA